MFKKKKLKLSKETLRNLAEHEEAQANGGTWSYFDTYCFCIPTPLTAYTCLQSHCPGTCDPIPC